MRQLAAAKGFPGMKNNLEGGNRADGRIEGILDPNRAETPASPSRAIVASDEATWHLPVALLLALLLHLAALLLIKFVHYNPPRVEAFEVQIVTLGDTGSKLVVGKQDGADDRETSATEPDPSKITAGERPPEGDRANQLPQPDAPIVTAPVKPPIATPKPKPTVAAAQPPRPTPPKVVETPAPPRAANPPLEEPIASPQAPAPNLASQPPEAGQGVPAQDPAYASLPAHVSSRLGAIGGGPVWQKGPPPKEAGLVPWGSPYWAKLQAWVREHGRYPPQAIPQRLEGVALIEFVIDRSGKVLTYRLLKSSNHYILDHEAKRMIEWSDPVPPLPPDLPGQYRDIIVEVVFEIYS